MDISKYKDKGYSGLMNLGNTCFINSTLQILSHTYELNEFLDSEKHLNLDKRVLDSEMMYEWDDLRQVLWRQNGKISPNKFIVNIFNIAKKKKRDVFTGFSQNDMPEFFLFMIECLHNSISRPIDVNITGKIENDIDSIAKKCYELLKTIYTKEYSEFMDLFYGIYLSEIVSKDKKKVYSNKPEQYLILDLPIKGEIDQTLYECFDNYINYELLEGENSWYNEKTKKKEDVNKRIIFWSFPKILVICLKRFSEDGSRKKMNKIDFPLKNLDLSKYVKGYNANKYKYDLYGICNHIGNVNGGHYTSYIKTANGEWIHFNDDNLSKVVKGHLITPLAYCLFYRQKNNII